MAQGTTISNNYSDRMDKLLREAVTQWWEGLTKDEILDYLRDQPDITADHLRQIFMNEDFVMNFGVTFSASSKAATADFHNA